MMISAAHSRSIQIRGSSSNMRAHRLLSTALFSTSPSIGSSTSKSINTVTNSTTDHNAVILATAPAFKPWPVPFIESKGDYKEESFLEEHIGGPLYESQINLPHLPVPTVQETISLFLKSALPLVENEEEQIKLINDCKSFPEDVSQLQKRLLERKDTWDKMNSSWLQLWWNQLGYLQIRDPSVVNVSYFFNLDDDKTLPAPSSISDFNHINQYNLGIKRGAAVLTAVAEHRKLVCSGNLPTERIGRDQVPLCSVGLKYLFHGCRIPKPKSDTYKIYDPSIYKHCIIAVKGQFYAMDFTDENDHPLPLDVLERGLEQCVQIAKDSVENGSALPEIGLFTACDRDSWADIRSQLIGFGGEKMEQSLALLESGAFILCLDETAPATKTECSKVYWHGDITSGPNRWFDKSMQFLCQSNGKLGFMGEHAMADGMPVVALCNRIKQLQYGMIKDKCHYKEKGMTSETLDVEAPLIQNIFEDAFDRLESDDSKKFALLLDKAKDDYESLVNKQEAQVLSFHSYGSDYIKKAKYSPDGLVQMALQLASYRLFGKQVGTYESSQVRFFLHGRTETTRSVSEASEAFVKAMGLYSQHNETQDVSIRREKLSLLKNATEYHSKYLKLAASGHGVDRHFFGLSMVAKESEIIPLFSNPVFARSKTWRLSTSTLPNIPGFGPVVEDGVGVGYEVRPDSCYFTITSRKENGYSEPLSHLLEESLLEIQSLIDAENPPRSKL